MLFKKSLTRELFYTSLSTILILSGIVIAQRAVIVFRFAAKGSIPNDAIDTVLVFNLLKHMPLLLSLTVFITILITLSRWYKDSEMIVWFSSGLGLYSLIKPIITFCFPIIILIASLSLFISPWAVQKAEEYKSGLKGRDEIATITPGTFKEAKSNNRIFYIEGFGSLGSKVKNIFIQSLQNGKLGVIVSNEGERVVDKDNNNYIVLKSGRRYEGMNDSKEFSTTSFDEYGILMEKNTKRNLNIGANAGIIEAIPTLDLIFNQNDSNRRQFLAELMWRISLPLSTMLLIFLAIPMSFINNRTGRSFNMIIAIFIFVIYNNFLGVFQSLISVGKIPLWLGFLPIHLLFGFTAFYLLHRRSLNLPLLPSRFIRKL
ncbi:MAG: LPS export ABC transporter permease LptF [Nitrosomonadales bacterium]|jgi:lipopolysaccharide export system permease protein|nr:LPS export ABC transporter permease LptF [Nitrosomonadales bacterium]